MTTAWDPATTMADKGGIFVRLADHGDKIVGAFCGEPYAREVIWTGKRYEQFDVSNSAHQGKRPSLRVMLNFYVPAEGAMKVIEGGTVWFKDVLKVRDKYGLDEWLFEIERHGDAGDPKTTYSILPKEKLDDEMRARIAAAEAHDLESAKIRILPPNIQRTNMISLPPSQALRHALVFSDWIALVPTQSIIDQHRMPARCDTDQDGRIVITFDDRSRLIYDGHAILVQESAHP